MAATRFIVQGYGNIGYRHAQLLKTIPGAVLAGIIEVDPANRELAYSCGDGPVYSSLENCLADGVNADVLNICTPNGLHYEHARNGLASGFHVLVEKPLALTVNACDALIDQAEKSGHGLFCVLQNRYSPPASWLKQVLSENRLGHLYMVNVNCYWNRGASYYQKSHWRGTANLDGGPLYTQFSHFVDLLPWSLGPVSLEEGRFFNFNHREQTAFEDSGCLFMSLESGAPVTMNYSTSAFETNIESSITILGEHGSVKIGGQYMNVISHCRIADYEMPEISETNEPNQYGQWKGSAANHQAVLEDVVGAVQNQNSNVTHAKEARASIRLIEEAYRLRDARGILNPQFSK